MTGDGAVVRDGYDDLKVKQLRDACRDLVGQLSKKAAEIERLTRERDEWRTASFRMEALYRNCREALALTSSDEAKAATARAEASEARTADLLKALEQAGAWFDEYGHIHQNKPVPDADKAKRNFDRAEFCWAAAKGGTV